MVKIVILRRGLAAYCTSFLQLYQPSVPGLVRSEGRGRGEDRQGGGSHSYARDEKGPQRSRAAGGSGLYNYAATRLGRWWQTLQISNVCSVFVSDVWPAFDGDVKATVVLSLGACFHHQHQHHTMGQDHSCLQACIFTSH